MHGGSLHKDAWFLVCSGALVNERTVVVAAHCVTDLGRVTVIKTADLKVVLGKFYRDDDRDEKSIQSLRVREGCSLEVRFLSRQLPAPGEQLSCQSVPWHPVQSQEILGTCMLSCSVLSDSL